MTQEITADQAARIHDLESYKAVTGAKRFKRTAEEMAMDLSPEQALKRRLATFDPVAKPTVAIVGDNGPTVEQWKRLEKAINTPVAAGDIVIRIRAAKGVDKDYFEHLPKAEIVVEQDNQFYGWLDVKLGGQFDRQAVEFFTQILNEGLGEAIDHPKFAAEPQQPTQPEAVNVES